MSKSDVNLNHIFIINNHLLFTHFVKLTIAPLKLVLKILHEKRLHKTIVMTQVSLPKPLFYVLFALGNLSLT